MSPWLTRLSLLSLLCLAPAAATVHPIDLTPRLAARNQLALETAATKAYLFDADFRFRLRRWLNHPSNFFYVSRCQETFRPYFTNTRVLGAMCYLLRQDPGTADERINPNRAYWVARRYLLEARFAASEIAARDDWTIRGDGRYPEALRARAQSIAEAFSDEWILALWRTCIADFANLDVYAKEQEASFVTSALASGFFGRASFARVGACLQQAFARPGKAPQPILWAAPASASDAPRAVLNFFDVFAPHPAHVVSETGWIGGNKLDYLVGNTPWQEMHNLLIAPTGGIPRYQLVERNYTVPLPRALPLAKYTGTVAAFRAKAAKNPTSWWKYEFTESQGFWPIQKHPVWQAEGSMLKDMLTAMDRAHGSIYLNMFFIGGTMGAAVAKHLITLAERGVKVFVMRDNINDFGYRAQMEPVFNYLWAYALQNPGKMLVAPSRITGHPTGLPQLFERVVTDEFIQAVGLQRHLTLYARAVSDHSKVLVIDGKVAPDTFRADGSRVIPTAYVGSKNWTDSSGALCIDETFKVQGPAAAVMLDDYYPDMREALRDGTVVGGLPQFGAIEAGVLGRVAREGWSRHLVAETDRRDELVAKILRPFDLLDRDGRGQPAEGARAVVTLDLPQGVGDPEWDTVVRTGMNNWDSTRANIVDQVIQSILFARQKILIKDQFLFDRNVVSALIRRKRELPSLDVRILLEPLLETEAAPGMPNILYLDLLAEAGIPVRFVQKIKDTRVVQEYHPKTVSVDGRYLIAGSANKDQTTMFGSFREQQIEAWSPRAAAIHDDEFEKFWNNYAYPWRGYGPRSETDTRLGHAEPGKFDPPPQLRGFDGQPLNTKQFVEFLRNVYNLVYDAMEL